MILRRTQQEVKNFNIFIFNSLNGPGQKPGMLSDVIHLSGPVFVPNSAAGKELQQFNFNSSNGPGYKPGMLNDVIHWSAM